MATILITGASRGLGLAFVKQLASLPSSKVSKIFATTRTDSSALNELSETSSGRVIPVTLDITSRESIKAAAEEVEKILGSDAGLDILINNAGVCNYVSDGVKSMDTLEQDLGVNVLGVHWVTAGFFPLLQRGGMKKVVNLSTTLGSITLAKDMAAYPCPSYKISKAALNALTVQWALDYEKEGFTFVAVSPGWLKTDLGGGEMADLTAEQGAKATLDIVFNKGREMNGKFAKIYIEGWESAGYAHLYDGTDSPW
ncbi:estradiol 17-beta-dehydrogenase 2 [Cladorrhinum sp. PSN259]|nr:estradiol 17-beta-dehydrogenase 2 [Cladorrhinum sp. PSN259]